jgi:hypothetical protein
MLVPVLSFLCLIFSSPPGPLNAAVQPIDYITFYKGAVTIKNQTEL